MSGKDSSSVAERMRAKLEHAFAPAELAITDESHHHAGHAGHDPRGESHFSVAMVSAAFVGKSRLERQRMVYAVVADELRDRVHALRLALKTEEEERAG